eukprot:CAMPEP_0173204652 /NCGR_PEP_ID=MMETSP1141-20130122/20255_1 /TAXON_ID=483371 /ORGANISM="non described non described, Strain CCMP2298" /LENGTH=43 /DNA_ID= /DNA_START= /DNA_END= /DNA_ORIENTATION=
MQDATLSTAGFLGGPEEAEGAEGAEGAEVETSASNNHSNVLCR